MPKHFNKIFPALFAILMLLWIYISSVNNINISSTRFWSQLLALMALTAMSMNLLLMTRAKWLEKISGGLGPIFHIHKWTGVLLTLSIIFHVISIGGGRGVGGQWGQVSFVFILIGAVLAVLPQVSRHMHWTFLWPTFINNLINYKRWKILHHILPLAFIAGIVHVFLVRTIFSGIAFFEYYLIIIATIGIISWLYKLSTKAYNSNPQHPS